MSMVNIACVSSSHSPGLVQSDQYRYSVSLTSSDLIYTNAVVFYKYWERNNHCFYSQNFSLSAHTVTFSWKSLWDYHFKW
jgi:hypothetical protein